MEKTSAQAPSPNPPHANTRPQVQPGFPAVQEDDGVPRQLKHTPSSWIAVHPTIAEPVPGVNGQTATSPTNNLATTFPQCRLVGPRPRSLRHARRGSNTLRSPPIRGPTGQPGGMRTGACSHPGYPPRLQQRWGRGGDSDVPLRDISAADGLGSFRPKS